MEERNKLDAKIQLLQEERQLINEHLDNQANKQRDVSSVCAHVLWQLSLVHVHQVEQIEAEMQSKSQMLKNSLANLEVVLQYIVSKYCLIAVQSDMEKLNMLIKGSSS